jgi:DNA-binding transcriptional LysR family regulator
VTGTVVIGVMARTGSAAAVALSGTSATPPFAGRREIELVPRGLVAQPYHAALGMDLAAAGELIAEVGSAAEKAAGAGLRALAATCSPGPVRAVAVVAKAVSIPGDLAGILRSHAWVHAAEGALYREAVLAGAAGCGWAAHAIDQSALPAAGQAVSALGRAAGRALAPFRELGARLFDRTPQGTTLTAAGEVFLPKAKALLKSASQAAAAAKAAARPSRITIGYTPGLLITPAVRQLRRQHPDADVQPLYLAWNEPRAALLDHQVDIVVTRLPLATDGLLVTILYDEPRLLMVPVGHRLAGKESVTLDDIADEPIPKMPDPVWNAYWRIDPRPDGTPAPDGPLVTAIEDKNELVAAGHAVAIIPGAMHGIQLRPDLTTIPLHGVDPAHVVVANRATTAAAWSRPSARPRRTAWHYPRRRTGRNQVRDRHNRAG